MLELGVVGSMGFNEQIMMDWTWHWKHVLPPIFFSCISLPPTDFSSSALQSFAPFELIKYNVEQDEPIRDERGFCIRVRPGKKR